MGRSTEQLFFSVRQLCDTEKEEIAVARRRRRPNVKPAVHYRQHLLEKTSTTTSPDLVAPEDGRPFRNLALKNHPAKAPAPWGVNQARQGAKFEQVLAFEAPPQLRQGASSEDKSVSARVDVGERVENLSAALEQRYGVKNMVSKGDKIFISLHYTPRTITLRKKFGNLPVRYMRTKIDSEEDFKILENVVKKYKFNLLDDDLDNLPLKSSSSGVVGTKRKYYLEAATRPEEEEDVDEDSEFAITQLLNIPKRQKTDIPTEIDDV